MNSLISQITGKSAVNEDDAVPVPANCLPRQVHRDRLAKERQKRYDLNNDDVPDNLKGVLGEAKGDVIPDDAKELDTSNIQGNITSRLNTVKDVVEEPARPKDPDEVFISPRTALTAPDATPDNMTASDPSKLPGVQKSMSTFTVPQVLSKPQDEETPAAQPETGDRAMRTMDLILGRRASGPARKAEDFRLTGAVQTEATAAPAAPVVQSEAQALSLMGMGATGESLLAQGKEMPQHVAADGKTILEAARRWI